MTTDGFSNSRGSLSSSKLIFSYRSARSSDPISVRVVCYAAGTKPHFIPRWASHNVRCKSVAIAQTVDNCVT